MAVSVWGDAAAEPPLIFAMTRPFVMDANKIVPLVDMVPPANPVPATILVTDPTAEDGAVNKWNPPAPELSDESYKSWIRLFGCISPPARITGPHPLSLETVSNPIPGTLAVVCPVFVPVARPENTM